MRLGTAALTLAVGLGFVGLASADESGNLFTRWFSPADNSEPAKKSDAKSDKTDPPVMPAASNNNRALQAKADLDRRQEVCMKLREVGMASSPTDEELIRKADALYQRAFDLYLAATNPGRRSVGVAAGVDANKGDRK